MHYNDDIPCYRVCIFIIIIVSLVVYGYLNGWENRDDGSGAL